MTNILHVICLQTKYNYYKIIYNNYETKNIFNINIEKKIKKSYNIFIVIVNLSPN